MEARLAGYLGDIETLGSAVVVRATVRPRDAAEGWELTLVVERGDQRHERVITNDACEGLAESTALLTTIAVAADRVDQEPRSSASTSSDGPMDPATTTSVPVPRGSADGPPTAELAPQPVAPVHGRDPSAPAARADARPVGDGSTARGLAASVRLSGGVDLRLLPVGAELELAVALSWPHLRVEVLGRHAIPRRFESPLLDMELRSWAWSIGGRGCGVLGPTPWLDLPLCAGVELGQMGGSLESGQSRGPTRQPWAAIDLSASLRLVVHPRIALWLTPEAILRIAGPDYYLDELLVRRTPWVGGRTMFGVEARFW
ncbi:MAG: hypothetical protein H6712_17700 [Myxococcales bacterium]|nr:hypothetical protein [Myxococcales bacterium]MCB9715709.1 hypothetical protein [Myxococcales bacterium]